MTCYLISRGGESIALVADIDMARAIAQCQPWGEYLVEAIEVPDAPIRGVRARRRSPDKPDRRPRLRPLRALRRPSVGAAATALDRPR